MSSVTWHWLNATPQLHMAMSFVSEGRSRPLGIEARVFGGTLVDRKYAGLGEALRALLEDPSSLPLVELVREALAEQHPSRPSAPWHVVWQADVAAAGTRPPTATLVYVAHQDTLYAYAGTDSRQAVHIRPVAVATGSVWRERFVAAWRALARELDTQYGPQTSVRLRASVSLHADPMEHALMQLNHGCPLPAELHALDARRAVLDWAVAMADMAALLESRGLYDAVLLPPLAAALRHRLGQQAPAAQALLDVLAAPRADHDRLLQEHASLRQAYETLETDHQTLVAEHNAHVQRATDLEALLAGVVERLAATGHENLTETTLLGVLGEHLARNDALGSSLEQARAEADALRRDRQDLEADLARLQSNADHTLSQLRAAEGDRGEAERQLAALQERYDLLDQESRTQTQLNATLSARMGQLQAELAHVEQAGAERDRALQRQVADAQRRAAEAEALREDALRQTREAEARAVALELGVARLTAEVGRLQGVLQAATDDAAFGRQQNTALLHRIDELTARCADAEHRAAKAERVLDHSREALRRLSKKRKALSELRNSTARHLRQARTSLKSLSRKLAQAQRPRIAATPDAERLRVQIEAERAINKDLRAKLLGAELRAKHLEEDAARATSGGAAPPGVEDIIDVV